MSDDVKAAIADALYEAGVDAVDSIEPRNEIAAGLAELAFDAAVEAGMLPPAEVERHKRAYMNVIRELEREQDDYREALERIVQLDDLGRPGTGEVARVALGGRFARAALDGDDRQEPTCGARRYEPRNEPNRPPDPPPATCDLPAGHDGRHKGLSIAGKRRVSWAALDGDDR